MRARMKVAECLIDTGDFHSALTALTDVTARQEFFNLIAFDMIEFE